MSQIVNTAAIPASGAAIPAVQDAPIDFSVASFTDRNAKGAAQDAFKFYTGRDATDDETNSILQKYGTGNIQSLTAGIYNDFGQGYKPNVDQNSDNMPDHFNQLHPEFAYLNQSADSPTGYSDETTRTTTKGERNGSLNSVIGRDQDVAEFLVKMDPSQTSKIFQSVGLGEGAATAAAQRISGHDWTGIRDEDRAGELEKLIPSLNGKALDAINKAMFGSDAMSDYGRQGGSGYHRAGTGDGDHNNADYKKFTVYDPEHGVGFTGGYVPEPIKTDWMGNIVLMALTAMVGVGAGAAIGAGASAAGVSGTGAVLADTAAGVSAAAGTGAAGTIGSIGGGMVAGASQAAVTDGNIGRGMLGGAVAGGLASFGNVPVSGNTYVDGALNGAGRGIIAAGVTGGDMGNGALSGAVTGAVTPVINSNVDNRLAQGVIRGGIGALVNYALRPDDPQYANTQATQTAAANAVQQPATFGRIVRTR